MKYRDLVEFQPIESVIQLNWADEPDRARALVAGYVISREMAERLIHVVIPQLRFDQPADNKGLLVVGNYGTGKSHLMAVISAILERGDLVSDLTDPAVADAIAPLAGRFKVVRAEIGDTEMSLRQIVVGVLENCLDDLGVDYCFPPPSEVVNNKDALVRMMVAFQRAYPDQGLLLVLDELLEYLRGRKDYALVRDLTFLRELGEACADAPFRFVAGIQEAIFDNPRFAFVAESLRRVKARFEQVHIARRDVQYVVSERLLKKHADQQTWIRSHLVPFTRFYGNMNERLDEFVRLFPIHPDYLALFERITAVEKREVLKTLTAAVGRILDQEVPEIGPGLIAYDDYWLSLRDDPSVRAVPDLRAVIDCSRILEDRVTQAFTRPSYRPAALRLVYGLSVYRLAVGEIDTPLGPTPEELRDGLGLFDPLVEEIAGEDAAADLLTYVETVLREVHRTVSGQFISQNADNRQWYLDLKKTEDYDALIDQRAESLDAEALDRAYLDALKQVLELSDRPQKTSFPLWEYDLEWPGHKATRPGWLFFGTPNERSTAQPPLDFYLYFLSPYQSTTFADENRPDEVFFRLTGADENFRTVLRRYAAATALADASSGQKKATYLSKASASLGKVAGWLAKNLRTAYAIACRGQTQTVAEWLQNTGRAGPDASVSEIVDAVAGVCLAPRFLDLAPEYPTFTTLVTRANRGLSVQDTLRAIRGPGRTARANAVLDALGLLVGDRLDPSESRYASYVLDKLAAKDHGQVLNRSELIEDDRGVEYLAPHRFRLEPEWAVVVLAALVYNGDLVLALPGKKLDATALDQLAATPLDQLVAFKHVEAPKDWNLPALQALFALLDLPPGNAQRVAAGGEGAAAAVQQLQTSVVERVAAIVKLQAELTDGFPFWGSPLVDVPARQAIGTRLTALKTFLESLQPFTSPARLKNLRYRKDEIEAQRLNQEALREAGCLRDFVGEFGPIADYLAQAAMALPADHPWGVTVEDARTRLAAEVTTPSARAAPGFRQQAAQRLAALKQDYLADYLDLHLRARLGPVDDARKKKLLGDPRLARLKRLATIDLLPSGQLTDLQKRLTGLVSCFALTQTELQAAPLCPHCRFQPAIEPPRPSAALVLSRVDGEVDDLLGSWTTILLANLDDPTVAENIDLLSPERCRLIADFRAARALPAELSQELILALQEVLSGLVKVVITLPELRAALLKGGTPATPSDLEERFKTFLKDISKGTDAAKARVVVE